MSTHHLSKSFILFLGLIIITVILTCLVTTLIRPFITFFIYEVLKADVVEVTLLTTAFMIGRASSSLIAGFISDYIRKKECLIFGLYGVGAIIFLYSLCSSWANFALLRIIQGLFAGMSWPIVQLIVGELSPPKIRSRVFALYFSSGDVGIALGFYLYSLMYSENLKLVLTYSSMLYIVSLTPLFISLIIAKGLGSVEQVRNASMDKPRRVINESSLYGVALIILITVAAGFTMGTLREFLYIFTYEYHGLSKGFLGEILSYSTIIGLAVSFLLAHITDVFGMKRSLPIIAFISAIALLLITMKIPTPILIISIGMVLAVNKSIMPLSRSLILNYVKRKKGLAIGFINMVGNVSVATYPVIAGYLYELFRGLRLELIVTEVALDGMAFLILSVMYLVIMFLLLKKR